MYVKAENNYLNWRLNRFQCELFKITIVASFDCFREAVKAPPELAFGGTSASIEVKDLEKEMLAKQKLQLIEELKKSQYMERLEYVHKRFLITLIRGGPTAEEIRQDLLSAGFAPEEFSIEYLRNSNFEMAYG
ncbi:hypothetical protein CAPTEDRAFT_203158 [Capitella teleta]|uniref:Uncharacterized protein n=1 Tax=Capitella teleta TaxID=283909 RepID=R7VFB1_CAPTE|nr:hypothetical protein CAPTEDRAFT_203158 [Capitella teleta]|eukprot:ELU14360.1 hypothetical protein CAPTEDRAFT_203158 [Capitella teleta]